MKMPKRKTRLAAVIFFPLWPMDSIVAPLRLEVNAVMPRLAVMGGSAELGILDCKRNPSQVCEIAAANSQRSDFLRALIAR
jgi:hypothetical protein